MEQRSPVEGTGRGGGGGGGREGETQSLKTELCVSHYILVLGAGLCIAECSVWLDDQTEAIVCCRKLSMQ